MQDLPDTGGPPGASEPFNDNLLLITVIIIAWTAIALALSLKRA